MTNEELATAIKAGDIEKYSDLWEQTKLFVSNRACAFCRAYYDTVQAAGVTTDDLIQSGYFALCEAVAAFKPNGYKLLTYLGYHLKTQFKIVCGIRTDKQDALMLSSSLDMPIGDDSDKITLLDTVEDTSTNVESEFIDREYLRELHGGIMSCLHMLNSEYESVIIMRYFKNYTYKQIAERLNLSIEKVKYMIERARHQLRSGKVSRLLKQYQEDLSTEAYKQTGLSAFKKLQSSSVERAVEKWCN